MRAIILVLALAGCAQASPGGAVINPHCFILCWARESPVSVGAQPAATPTITSAPLPPALPRRVP